MRTGRNSKLGCAGELKDAGQYGNICNRIVGLYSSAFSRGIDGFPESGKQDFVDHFRRLRGATGSVRLKRDSAVSDRANRHWIAGRGFRDALCQGEEIHAVRSDGFAVSNCFGGAFIAALTCKLPSRSGRFMPRLLTRSRPIIGWS
jgi:hypothetical protein